MSYYDNPIYIQGKQFLFKVLNRGGFCALFRRRHRNSILVLTYHDILPSGFPADNSLFGMSVSTEEFEWQLDHIQSHYTPISLQQLGAWFAGTGSLPPQPVLITFDDGHTNNLNYALPSLQKRGIPAVCFVVAGNLGSRHLLCVEEGYSRLMSPSGGSWVTRDGTRHARGSVHDRAVACSHFFRLFQKLSEEDQDREMESLRRQMPLGDDATRFPARFEFLSPAQLRALHENEIGIGAHSLTHPILSTLSADRARAEIADSKARLEEASGSVVHAFAYPFGQPGDDFGERDKDFAREAGYQLAFSGAPGFVNRDSDPFCLPRFGVGRMSRDHFVATITGALGSIKQLWGRQ